MALGRVLSIVAFGMILASAYNLAAEQTWTGTISDSLCKMKHEVGEGEEPLSDADCTRACVRGGSRLVFLRDGAVLEIANQDHPDLRPLAGIPVRLTGTLQGSAITVTRIEKAR